MNKLGARIFIVFLRADLKWQFFGTEVSLVVNW